jgi:acyl-CoA reductase-like NAD-dependent aldehyde dehydrogenase
MTETPHIPILRWGEEYQSLDVNIVRDYRNGNALAKVSQANVGLLRKDLLRTLEIRDLLSSYTVQDLLDICVRAADIFCEDTLSMGDAEQSPERYVELLSGTSGLPHALCWANMKKLHKAMSEMPGILRGLSRGLDMSIIDAGTGEQNGLVMSYLPATDAIAGVLPSNSPGVNSIWLPAFVLKIPVVLKPGREEPWTPYRVIQSLIKAGAPAAAFGFYPTSHEGADLMMRRCGRGIIFGDDKTTERYAHNPNIERHGTGRSKILVGEDMIDQWPELVDLMVTSVSNNGGRSCVCASTIIVPRHADEIAKAVAEKLARLEPKGALDPDAQLSAFANPRFAELIDKAVESSLEESGATDVTASYRDAPRLSEFEGGKYLLPTIVRCDSIDHPLGNTEFLFPFASVVEMPQAEMISNIGPSLVVSVISEDQAFIDQAVSSPDIDRLNIGRLPTTKVEWDQPHEGNLFELLYRRRAVQRDR